MILLNPTRRGKRRHYDVLGAMLSLASLVMILTGTIQRLFFGMDVPSVYRDFYAVRGLILIVIMTGGALIVIARERRTAEMENAMPIEVLDKIPVGVVGADRNGRITYINTKGALMLGYADGSELVGGSLERIIPEDLRVAHRVGLLKNLATGQARVLEKNILVPVLRRDGSILPMILSLSRVGEGVVNNAAVRFYATLRPVRNGNSTEFRIDMDLVNDPEHYLPQHTAWKQEAPVRTLPDEQPAAA